MVWFAPRAELFKFELCPNSTNAFLEFFFEVLVDELIEHQQADFVLAAFAEAVEKVFHAASALSR